MRDRRRTAQPHAAGFAKKLRGSERSWPAGRRAACALPTFLRSEYRSSRGCFGFGGVPWAGRPGRLGILVGSARLDAGLAVLPLGSAQRAEPPKGRTLDVGDCVGETALQTPRLGPEPGAAARTSLAKAEAKQKVGVKVRA